MNRAIDKPAEHIQVAADGGPIIIIWQRDESDTLESGSSVVEIEAKEVDDR
jgi:hypothetical protein